MRKSAYKQYLLAVLAIILAFNYVDRLAVALVLQDIKADLGLSDTQLGLLTGIAFAFFYSVMGIPIARWADRGNRVFIISVTTALWSAAVALCGAASSFVQLLLIRVLAAIGEAGCLPAAHSLIADYFGRDERPRAVARFMLGIPLGAVIGFSLAGWLNQFYGWRLTFVLLGLPGVALAGIAWLTVKEPRQASAPTASLEAQPRMQEVLRTLWTIRTFRHLLLCISFVSFFGYGIQQWKPAFFTRTYGLSTGELGTWLTLIYGVGAFAGTYLGGEWAARFAASNERLQLKVLAAIYASFAVISSFIYLSPNHYMALAMNAIATLGGAAATGPLFATIQTVVADRMRAAAIAIIYLFANLIGMGLGPLAAGILSDAFQSWAGDDSLRYALLVLCPGYLWAGWHLWRGSKTVARDLAAVVPARTTAITPATVEGKRARDMPHLSHVCGGVRDCESRTM